MQGLWAKAESSMGVPKLPSDRYVRASQAIARRAPTYRRHRPTVGESDSEAPAPTAGESELATYVTLRTRTGACTYVRWDAYGATDAGVLLIISAASKA